MTTPYRHVKVVYFTKYRLIGWVVLFATVCRHALFREVFWRVIPSVTEDRKFESDSVEYLAQVRFSAGRWFGPWHPIEKQKPGLFGF